MKVAIVGAGLFGLSTAWALTREGHDVAVYEAGPAPNPRGSSVDSHRLIRFPYGESDAYTRMVADAYGAWDRLWADLGQRYYVETGTLAFSSGADDWVGRTAATLDRCGVAWSRLEQAELVRQYPFYDFAGIAWGLYLPTGGELLADRIVAGLLAWLRAHGRPVHEHTAVQAVEPDHGRLILASGAVVNADAVVVAAGPWTNRLLPELAREMTPSRQVVVYLDAPAADMAALAAAPMILDIGADAGVYVVPPRMWNGSPLGLKVGDHSFSLEGDPDADRTPPAAEVQRVLDRAARRLRGFAAYRVAGAKTCFYDVSAEERFIVRPLGARAWVMTGFSGHGFKFGALVGEQLAAAVAGRLDPTALADWAAGR